MPKTPPAAPLALLALLTGGACLEPFRTPSAYEDQVFLCHEDSAFDAGVSACRARRARGEACGGLMSLRGHLQGRPLTVTSELRGTVFVEHASVDGGRPALDGIETEGKSPYFLFALQSKSLGGDPDVAEPGPRTLRVDPSATRFEDAYSDDDVNVSLRLSVSRESVDLIGLADSGVLTILSRTPDELHVRMGASFGAREDRLDLCFSALRQSIRREF